MGLNMRIGIDLGGTKIEAAVMDGNGRIVARNRMPTPQKDYSATLNVVADLIAGLEKDLEAPAAIGIATPGSVSTVTDTMKNCNSTCLNGQPLLQDLSRLLKREVRMANDADCFTLSEASDGAAAGCNTVFGVILGTGVGGGICHQGRLLQGPNRIAGEWGHNPLPPLRGDWQRYRNEARDCYCGWQDCIETYLSGPGFELGYQTATGIALSAEQIADKAREGEELALLQLNLYQERLACALANVINLLDPDAIVLGGGMSNIRSLYSEVPKRWEKYVFSDRCDTRLVAPKFGDSSGVRGAAWLWNPPA